jgi:hypothetical protein
MIDTILIIIGCFFLNAIAAFKIGYSIGHFRGELTGKINCRRSYIRSILRAKAASFIAGREDALKTHGLTTSGDR